MLSTYKKVLFSMAPVYFAYKKSLATNNNNIDEYSIFLIDKFASQSSTFYHISNGFIESIRSTEEQVLTGFDIFSFNSTFRAIIETYVTFNGLFVTPANVEEKKAKFLLWKIDGLTEKAKLEFEEDVLSLESDKKQIQLWEDEFEQSDFYKLFNEKGIKEIYKRGKVHNWKFTTTGINVKPYGTLKFSKIVTKSTAISNIYNLTSMHVHSGFYAIEQFKKVRGKIVNDNYIDSNLVQAVYITACLIKDLTKINEGAMKAYNNLDIGSKEIIEMAYTKLRGEE